MVSPRSNTASERTVDYRGRALVASKLLAGSACGERQRGRPLNALVRRTEKTSA